MKYNPIQKFGSKLMVASKSINNIPKEYLKYSLNARIYDWWIWPRKGKQILTNSTLWTNNKGGFTMLWKLYQICNSKIYEVDKITWVQTEKASLWYDNICDTVTFNNLTIIASEWVQLQVFNWTTLTTPATQPASNNWFIEFYNLCSFIAKDNVLYISRPITLANPEYWYDFTWTNAIQRTYDSKILWLKKTLNWIYVFTENIIEHISDLTSTWAVANPLWDWWQLINNKLVAISWDKVFYINKDLNINTINYIQWTAETWLWELSNQQVVWIKELLNGINIVQNSWIAFLNESEKTINFHLRSVWSPFNDICITYDLINQTFNVDTQKNYNNVVKIWSEYFWFSDINSSIYKDNVWNSDNWIAIPFLIKTQEMNLWSMQEKIFGGFFTTGAIGWFTTLTYKVFVDREEVFTDDVTWENIVWDLWEIGWETIGIEAIWWDTYYTNWLNPFDLEADVWRIYQSWIRISFEIYSNSQIQDFIIDWLWIIAEQTPLTTNKF